MDKTVTITIAGELFHVEEAAFQELDRYLRSVRAHFETFPDAAEIVSDIENRIAQEFFAKLSARKKVITEKDVDKLIKAMGTVRDFQDFEGGDTRKNDARSEEAAAAPSEPRPWKRLYRDADDQMLGGVCAGLAKYLGMDPSIVRLLFAVTIFFGGAGIIIYILLWIILPEAKTASEKVEMAQGRVTLAAIQQKVRERLPKGKGGKAVRRTGSLINRLMRGIFQVIRAVFLTVVRLIGLLVVIAASVTIAAITTAAVFILVNPSTLNPDFAIAQAVGWILYVVIVFSGYLAMLFLLILVILGGSTLLTLQNALHTKAVVPLFVQFLVWGTITAACVFAVAPRMHDALEQFEGNLVKETTMLTGFRAVSAGGDTNVTITRGPYAVTLEGPEYAMETFAKAHVDEYGFLTATQSSVGMRHCVLFCHASRLKMTVSMPELELARTDGSARMRIEGFTGATMALGAYQGSRLSADVSVRVLEVQASDGARLDVSGAAGTLKADLLAEGRLDASALTASSAILTVRHAARADVRVTGALEGEVSHAGRVTVHGEPKNMRVNTSQAGRVRSAGNEL